MVSIKQISFAALVCILLAGAIALPISALEESELNNISQNCTTIKQSLTQLQRADSRTRAYLGSSYEQISNTFIVPLNARLVKNDIVNTELLEIQANFSETQAKFRSAYTDYMREFESLLSIDCARDPQNFYNRLKVVRERRATLRKTTDALSALAKQQLSAATKLKEQL